MKQPDLAFAELLRETEPQLPELAQRLRALAGAILPNGPYGVFPNVAGFTVDLTIPPPDPTAEPAANPTGDDRAPSPATVWRLSVPVVGDGWTYGEVGVNPHRRGTAWNEGAIAVLPAPTAGDAADSGEAAASPRELLVELTIEPADDGAAAQTGTATSAR